MELFPAVIAALQELSDTAPGESAVSAHSLLFALHNIEFLVGAVVSESLSSIVLPLSKLLQAVDLDMILAVNLIKDVLDILEEKRRDAENAFHSLFQRIEVLCDQLNIAIELPRRTGRQQHRSNYCATTPECFFRISVYIPYIDHVINEISSRFHDVTERCKALWAFVPFYLMNSPRMEDVSTCFQLYAEDMNTSETVLMAEYEMWKKKWTSFHEQNESEISIPKNAITALSSCPEVLFPNIHKILRIIVTLPVSTASAERSFSTLRRLKTYLRSTMSEERLTGLALMTVHRERNIPIEKIISRMAVQSRKLQFS